MHTFLSINEWTAAYKRQKSKQLHCIHCKTGMATKYCVLCTCVLYFGKLVPVCGLCEKYHCDEGVVEMGMVK